jgi:glycerate dehydrogenase
MVRIVILEAHHSNPGDLSWAGIQALGEVIIHQRTTQEQLVERSLGADILITNKLKITKEVLGQLPKLKLIHQLATGTDNIDKAAAKEHGVIVMNAVGYSTTAVAQQVFALILQLSNRMQIHHEAVQANEWTKSGDWCHMIETPFELKDKTLGIIGYGKIGQATAKIGLAFGMRILVVSSHATQSEYPDIEVVTIDELASRSDVVSIHSPLTAENSGMINQAFLAKMKSSALLINTARGGHINEEDLSKALKEGVIAGAGLDVLKNEPPQTNHPLIGLRNCIITPHIAWTAFEARKRLLQIVESNLINFIKDKKL